MASRDRRVRGSGSIYFDEKRGLWVGQAPLPRGAGGKRRRITVYGKTAAEAQAKLDDAKRAHDPGGPHQTLKTYLTWFCDDYLAGRHARGEITARTMASYKQNLLGHVVDAIGHVRLNRLHAQDLTALLGYLSKKGLAPATQRLIYSHLRSALSVAEQFGRVEKNWAKVMSAPRKATRRHPTPTVEQAGAIFDAAAEHRSRALFTVMLAFGLRVSEAIGICWSDIDLEAGTLRLHRQLQREDGRWRLVSQLKWRDEDDERLIPLPPFVVTVLREHRRAQAEQRLRVGARWRVVDGLDDLVFRMPLGEPVWPDQVRRELTKLCETADVPRFTPHALRRAAATFLIARGVPIPAVMEILGWKTARIALEVYAEAQRDSLDAAAATIEDLYGGR